MICHLCGQQAVGQCQTCLKFYCAGHGDRVCVSCATEQAITAAPPARAATEVLHSEHSCYDCAARVEGACRRCGRFYCSRHGRHATCGRCYDSSRVVGLCVASAAVAVGLGVIFLVPASAGISPWVGLVFLGLGAACFWQALRPFP
jgi:hypothetical protein